MFIPRESAKLETQVQISTEMPIHNSNQGIGVQILIRYHSHLCTGTRYTSLSNQELNYEKRGHSDLLNGQIHHDLKRN